MYLVSTSDEVFNNSVYVARIGEPNALHYIDHQLCKGRMLHIYKVKCGVIYGSMQTRRSIPEHHHAMC